MTNQDRDADRLALADRIRAHIGTIAPKCSLPVGEWNDIAEDFYEAADQLFAHPAASQGGVPGCGVPGCNDPTCDYGHEAAPSRPAAQPGVREALRHAQVRFQCLADHFKETGDEALWAMSEVDAERMEKALAVSANEVKPEFAAEMIAADKSPPEATFNNAGDMLAFLNGTRGEA